jgi:hypothetical protein
MPYDKRKRPGSQGADGGPVQRRVAPGRRTLTSRLPGAVQARTEDQQSLGPLDPTPPTMVGPGHGSPIPPIEAIRKYYAQRDGTPPPASSGEISPGRDAAVYDHAGRLEQLSDARDPSNSNNALSAHEMYEAWRNNWSSRDAQARQRLQGLKDRMRSEDALGYAEKKERFDAGLRDALGPEYEAAENQAALCSAELSSMEEVLRWLEGQETLGHHVTLDQVSHHALEWANAREKYSGVVMTLFLLALSGGVAGGGASPATVEPVAEPAVAEGAVADEMASEGVTADEAYPRSLGAAAARRTKQGGRFTEPDLPPRTIVEKDGVRIQHFTRSGDHAPAHLHVYGGGPPTKIGQAGRPLDGSPALTATQQSVVDASRSALTKAVDQIQRWFRFENKY